MWGLWNYELRRHYDEIYKEKIIFLLKLLMHVHVITTSGFHWLLTIASKTELRNSHLKYLIEALTQYDAYYR